MQARPRQPLLQVHLACDDPKHVLPYRTSLLQRRGAIVNMTGDDAALSAASPHISSFLSALPATAADKADWAGCLPAINEALTVPTQVRYCRLV